MAIARFLIGSGLLFIGCMIILSGSITVIGLPVGLAVVAAALELMLGPGRRRADRKVQESREAHDSSGRSGIAGAA